jgi:phospholipid/cholesterol/gamma-HCH transport system permease protein
MSGFGHAFLRSHVGQLFSLSFLALASLFSTKGNRKIDIHQIISQIYHIGIVSLPLIFTVGVIFGTVLIMISTTYMLKVGFGSSFGDIIVVAIVQQLGPILTAFLIAGRSGSSLTTRIASMKVNSEIDALETLGISYIRFLVMPAFIGSIVAMVIATCFFCLSAIGAGFLITKIIAFFLDGFITIQLEWGSYSLSILTALSPLDFVMGLLKPIVFAAIITTNACYFGTRIPNDQRAVPIATSRAVVSSFIFIVVSNLLLSATYIPGYISSMKSVI